MKYTLKSILTLTAILVTTGTTHAALAVTLHQNAFGNTTVSISGSGTTGLTCTSQLCNGLSLQEQWSNMSGNPFDDTANVNNADFIFVSPIPLTPTVDITGIQIDNDNTGDDQDDFKILISSNLGSGSLGMIYNVNGVSELTNPLAFSSLNTGTFTDDTDGGTTFLGGFNLVITTDPAPVPEPSSAFLLGIGALGLTTHRRRTK